MRGAGFLSRRGPVQGFAERSKMPQYPAFPMRQLAKSIEDHADRVQEALDTQLASDVLQLCEYATRFAKIVEKDRIGAFFDDPAMQAWHLATFQELELQHSGKIPEFQRLKDACEGADQLFVAGVNAVLEALNEAQARLG
jgi:hypothetical protein